MALKIGMSAGEATTPKARPSNKLSAKGLGSTSKGTKESAITGLKAGGLGHKSRGRKATAVTSLRAPK